MINSRKLQDLTASVAVMAMKNREFPHFQYTGGLSLADFKAGKRI